LWLGSNKWQGLNILGGTEVAAISSSLQESTSACDVPFQLKGNADISYHGTVVYGKGFVLSEEEAHSLISSNAKNEEVLLRYFVGQELNTSPNCTPSRWVINFQDWPLNRDDAPPGYDGPVATDYLDCLLIIENRVKPERDTNKRKVRREKWWQFGERAPALYAAIAELDWCLAVASQATKYVAFGIVSGKTIYSHALTILATDSFGLFAVLTSCFHDAWARRYGSYNLALLRYSPSDLLLTYPLPRDVNVRGSSHNTQCEVLGAIYHAHRKETMLSRQEGLTNLYNHFHDPNETAKDIQKLRDLHVEMDKAVAVAYGWTDLDLDYGYRDTKQGLRFTISDPARRETLARLLKLNHERYAEEVAQGLHNKKKPPKGKGPGVKKKTNVGKEPSLFDGENQP